MISSRKPRVVHPHAGNALKFFHREKKLDVALRAYRNQRTK